MAGAPAESDMLQVYKADINSEYPITKEHVTFYRENGFIRLKQVQDALIGEYIASAACF